MPVMAGSEHDHGHSYAQAPVNQHIAEKNAGNVIASLVEREKIDTSWASIKASSVEKKSLNGYPRMVSYFQQ